MARVDCPEIFPAELTKVLEEEATLKGLSTGSVQVAKCIFQSAHPLVIALRGQVLFDTSQQRGGKGK
jgi:hypothetical protein